MANRSPVKVDDVSLTSVSVTVKAVQIGRKQMTLAVFRQLTNAPVWNVKSCRPNGKIWGRVNYSWDGCGCTNWVECGITGAHFQVYSETRGDVVHVIWQFGNEIRRSCISSVLGEAAVGYPYAQVYGNHRVVADTTSKRARAWQRFYTDQILAAEQLFIAV